MALRSTHTYAVELGRVLSFRPILIPAKPE